MYGRSSVHIPTPEFPTVVQLDIWKDVYGFTPWKTLRALLRPNRMHCQKVYGGRSNEP